MKNITCKRCGERPIHNKKRELCLRCYGHDQYVAYRNKQRKLKQAAKPSLIQGDNYAVTDETVIQHKAELEFIELFFSDSGWIYHPAIFYLSNGKKYRPDFYDTSRGCFIEVCGTRQRYHQAKHIYSEFKQLYPSIEFEIRYPDGSLLNDGRFHIPANRVGNNG